MGSFPLYFNSGYDTSDLINKFNRYFEPNLVGKIKGIT
jgi:hypothetical protein